MFYEPHIDHVTLTCPRLPEAFEGLRLLHLSDLHISRWTRRLDSWRAALHSLSPDLIVMTGDLGHRAWTWKQTVAAIGKLLGGLHPALGIYFILGNHDTLKMAPALTGLGYMYLKNQSVILAQPTYAPAGKNAPLSHLPDRGETGIHQPRLALIGLDQHRRIDTDFPRALRQVHRDDFKLILLHYPDLIHQAAAAGADVCLAGHTHGGQICWPDGHPIIRHDVLSQAMCTGVHKVADTWLVVNRGIGAAGLRIRVFCPPQAIMLTLRRTNEK